MRCLTTRCIKFASTNGMKHGACGHSRGIQHGHCQKQKQGGGALSPCLREPQVVVRGSGWNTFCGYSETIANEKSRTLLRWMGVCSSCNLARHGTLAGEVCFSSLNNERIKFWIHETTSAGTGCVLQTLRLVLVA